MKTLTQKEQDAVNEAAKAIIRMAQAFCNHEFISSILKESDYRSAPIIEYKCRKCSFIK